MMVGTVERQALKRRADLQPPRELEAQAPVDATLEGKLVLVRGELFSQSPLLDPQFGLKQPVPALKREVLRFDGKAWQPAHSPKLPDTVQLAPSVHLGVFEIEQKMLETCPDWRPLPLIDLPAKSGFKLVDGEAVARQHPKKPGPEKGDLRVRFSQLPNSTATVLGHQRGTRLVGRLRLGSPSWVEMDPSVAGQQSTPPAFVWVPRFFGWLVMSLGLGLSYPLALATQPKIKRLGCFPYTTGLAAGLVALSVACAPASGSPAFLGLTLVSAIPVAMLLQAWFNRPPDKPVWQD